MSGARGTARASRPTPALDANRNVLAELLAHGVRPWGSQPVRLSPAVIAASWVLLTLNLAFAGWLLAVHEGGATCDGLACTVVTLGDHALLAFLLATSCVVALAMAAPRTRGLSRTDGPQLAVVVGGALCGGVALAGVIAVVVGAALSLALALGVFVVVADRL